MEGKALRFEVIFLGLGPSITPATFYLTPPDQRDAVKAFMGRLAPNSKVYRRGRAFSNLFFTIGPLEGQGS